MKRKVDEKSLDGFEQWLLGRARVAETAASYKANVRRCAEDGPILVQGNLDVARLKPSSKLSPNTKWQTMASLKSWARYTKDAELKEALDDFRLPPARRITKKVPITTKQWKDLVALLRSNEKVDPVHRVVIVIMALRGLRLGDVFRIERLEVLDAIRTGTLSAVAKGNKRRHFSAKPIMEDLKVLAGYPVWTKVRDLVGQDTKTERALGNKIRRTLKRYGARVGVESCYPHQLRRTFATEFLNSMHGDPKALIKLQQYMDWSDLSTAARYVDDVDAEVLNAAADRMVEGM